VTQRPADEGKLRRYLLGSLPEEESEELERRYFGEGSLFEELLAEEDEILDSYAAGDLSDEERRRFEKLLGSSNRLRNRAAFAKTLLRLERRTGFHVPRAVLLLAATLVLALGGLWIVRDSDRRSSGGEVAVHRDTPLPVAPAGTPPPASGTPLPAAAKRTPNESRPGAHIVSFALAAGLTRSASNTALVSIPRGAEAVALDLALETDEHAAYSLILQTAAGAEVLSRRGLRARGGNGGRIVRLEVSARALLSGDYLVTLSGEKRSGPAEALGEYAFRVRKD